MKSSIERFTNRVSDYRKYRPSYPPELLIFLEKNVLPPGPVADIGAGTGIFTGQLLARGYEVFAIEPNRAMAAAAKEQFSLDPRFHGVPGLADETGLPSSSVRLITCAQSFHWFDRERVKKEFRRILMPAGHAAIVWNERLERASPFQEQYEKILHEFAPEYTQVAHHNVTSEQIQDFFSPGSTQRLIFSNPQTLSREQLIGRALSSSYVPKEGEPGHREIVSALETLFDQTQVDGVVRMDCETRAYFGSFESQNAA